MRHRVSIETLHQRVEQRLREQALPGGTVLEPAVTIGRQTGAGGFEVAQGLARVLQAAEPRARPWTVVDRELVRRASDDPELQGMLKRLSSLEDGPEISTFLMELRGAHAPLPAHERRVAQTIRRLCQVGRIVLLCRGANLLARDRRNALHVLLVGSVERRVARVIRELRMERREARLYVEDADGGRTSYVKEHFARSVLDPQLYHVTLHTDHFEDTAVVTVLTDMVAALRERAPRVTPRRFGLAL